jgi:hypothetical protein
MRRIPQKLVARLLVALYGGIALLGYGLHELAPAEDHHHHALGLAVADAGPLSVRSGHIDADHDCDICAFLDQARGDQPQVATGIVWQHVVAAVEVVTPPIVSQTAEFSHVPRGPPTHLG